MDDKTVNETMFAMARKDSGEILPMLMLHNNHEITFLYEVCVGVISCYLDQERFPNGPVSDIQRKELAFWARVKDELDMCTVPVEDDKPMREKK